MERIVFLNRPSEGEAALIECLRILFPECEIQVQSGPGPRVGEFTASQKPAVYDGDGGR